MASLAQFMFGSNLGNTQNLAHARASTVGFASAKATALYPLWGNISQESPNYTTAELNYGTAPFGTITNVETQEAGGPRSGQVTGRLSF